MKIKMVLAALLLTGVSSFAAADADDGVRIQNNCNNIARLPGQPILSKEFEAAKIKQLVAEICLPPKQNPSFQYEETELAVADLVSIRNTLGEFATKLDPRNQSLVQTTWTYIDILNDQIDLYTSEVY